MQIDLRRPIRGEWEGRGFGRRFIWTYECSFGHTVRVKCSKWRGKMPDVEIGAIVCPQCTVVETKPIPVELDTNQNVPEITCPRCHGHGGRFPADRDACTLCDGNGQVSDHGDGTYSNKTDKSRYFW